MAIRRLLLIERESPVQAVLCHILEASGYELIAAADALEGLKSYYETAPQCIIASLSLSDVKNFEILHAMRELQPELPIILLAQSTEVARLSDAPSINVLLTRPYRPEQILGALQDLDAAAQKSSVEVVDLAGMELLNEGVPLEPDLSLEDSDFFGESFHENDKLRTELFSEDSAMDLIGEDDSGLDDFDLDGLDLDGLELEVPETQPLDPSTLIEKGAEVISEEQSLGVDLQEPFKPANQEDELLGFFQGDSSDGLDALLGSSESLDDYDNLDLYPSEKPQEFRPDPEVSKLSSTHPPSESVWADEFSMELEEDTPLQEKDYKLHPMTPHSPSDPRGIYGSLNFPQLLYRCFRDLFTGRLLIRRKSALREFVIANGQLISGNSNIHSDFLSQLLIEDGIITEEQHELSLKQSRQEKLVQGEVLVQMEVISPGTLKKYLRKQFRRRLLNTFPWRSAEYGLSYDPSAQGLDESIRLNPLVIIFEGIKSFFPIAPLVDHFDDFNLRKLKITPLLGDYTIMLKDFKEELRVAKLCDGERNLGEILGISPYGLVSTLRILRALEIMSCVLFGEVKESKEVKNREDFRHKPPSTSPNTSHKPTVRPRRKSPKRQKRRERTTVASQTAPELEGEEEKFTDFSTSGLDRVESLTQIKFDLIEKTNHYQFLEITQEANLEQIRKAFEILSKRLQNAREHETPEIAEKARKVLQALATSFEVLSSRNKREAYDALTLPVPRTTGLDVLKAESNFNRGRCCLENLDTGKALRFFKVSCLQDPHQPQYQGYKAYAEFLQADPNDKKSRSEAIDQIQLAFKEDDTSDNLAVLLGHLYKGLKNMESAVRFYQKALSINRRNPEAARALREINRSEHQLEKESSSLFGKLFRR